MPYSVFHSKSFIMGKASCNQKHAQDDQTIVISFDEYPPLFKALPALVHQGDRKIGVTYGEWYDCDEDEYVENGGIYERCYKKLTVPHLYCPFCHNWHQASVYLGRHISDERTRWMANMVTHYRHHHIMSWNKCWGRNGGFYRNGWFNEDDYEKKKKEYNERAKRQIIRKCAAFMNNKGITLSNIEALQNTTAETLEVARKNFLPK
jgi:hypothetical protein